MLKKYSTVAITLLLVTLMSCKPPGDYFGTDSIAIHVENQTGSDLTGVKVFVVQQIIVNGKYRTAYTDSSSIATLADRNTATGMLYEKNIQGVDGSYLLTATGQTGKKYKYVFGYLTNGSFLEAHQYLTVTQDTIIVKR